MPQELHNRHHTKEIEVLKQVDAVKPSRFSRFFFFFCRRSNRSFRGGSCGYCEYGFGCQSLWLKGSSGTAAERPSRLVDPKKKKTKEVRNQSVLLFGGIVKNSVRKGVIFSFKKERLRGWLGLVGANAMLCFF